MKPTFPALIKFSVLADTHEDNANIHVPAADRARDTRVHLVTSPSHHTVYLVRVVWQTVDLPQPSLPLHGDVSHSKDLLWWYIRLCFCLLSVIIGLFVCKTSVAMKCLPVITSGHLNGGACQEYRHIEQWPHTACSQFSGVSSGHFFIPL